MNAAWLSRNTWVLLLLVVPVAAIAGAVQGAGAAILALVAAALVSVIALFWSSVRTLAGETAFSGADAYALAAPRAEEEQKQAVLRALKDLEFERSVGKISDEDYAALVTQYRAEAKRLLRVLDEGARPGRARVESLVHDRLVAAGLEAPLPREDRPHAAEPAASKAKGKKKKKGKGEGPARTVEIVPADAPEKPVIEPEAKKKSAAAAAAATKVCGECDTKNDPDANFCKKCGSKNFIGEAGSPEGGPPAAKDGQSALSEAPEREEEAGS